MFVETVSSAKKKVLFVKYKRGIMLAEPRCAFWNLVCHQADNAGVAGPGAAWVTGLGVLPLTSAPWALHPFHSFPHETGKHRHDHFGVHFHQVFWEGIHSCSNFSGHGDGILCIVELLFIIQVFCLQKVIVNGTWLNGIDEIQNRETCANLWVLETRDGRAFLRLLQRFIHPVDNNVIVDLLPTTNFFKDVQCVPSH